MSFRNAEAGRYATPTAPRPASASASAMTPTVRLSLNYCIEIRSLLASQADALAVATYISHSARHGFARRRAHPSPRTSRSLAGRAREARHSSPSRGAPRMSRATALASSDAVVGPRSCGSNPVGPEPRRFVQFSSAAAISTEKLPPMPTRHRRAQLGQQGHFFMEKPGALVSSPSQAREEADRPTTINTGRIRSL